MTEPVSYRRSNLRDALLDRALTVLNERGEAAVSLRELAREVGVSHAAPARHFSDRRQLIEALAVEGFRQLETDLRNAVGTQDTLYEQARSVARAYVDFAVTKANLTDVMYRHETGVERERIGTSAAAAFEPILQLFQRATSTARDAEASATLFLATLQGLTSLAACGVVAPDAAAALIDDVVPRFLSREL
jgi:AcrR family transcriptional regulator